jgi:hypothetical protein
LRVEIIYTSANANFSLYINALHPFKAAGRRRCGAFDVDDFDTVSRGAPTGVTFCLIKPAPSLAYGKSPQARPPSQIQDVTSHAQSGALA